MDKLQELYAKRKVFEDYGAEIPVDLQNEILQEEHILFERFRNAIASYLPDEVGSDAVSRLVFGAEYVNGKLTSIGASTKPLEEIFDSYQEVNSKETSDDVPTDDEVGEPDTGIKRSKSIGFIVKFADGKTIKHTTAQRTMIEALKYIGLERASKYRGEMFKGFPLISKEQRITNPPHRWQKNVDGWWIYINMSNHRAVTCIKGVADMLNISLDIEMDADESQSSDSPKGKRIKYSLNGGEPTWKNRTVWNTVQNLVQELPNASFKEISDFFPKSLQGSYGVVAAISDIEERSKRNKSEYNRWFLDPTEILTAGDGIRFAVTTEWGDNFENFRVHVIREFGWAITEA